VRRVRWLIWVLLAVGAPPAAWAQQPITLKSEVDEYLRVLEVAGKLTGPMVFRSPSTLAGLGLRADTAHPWAWRYGFTGPRRRAANVRLRLFDTQDLKLTYNSALPWGTNDGRLWAGRGLSGEVSGLGGELTWGPLTATLAFAETFTANQWFATWPVTAPASSPYAYPWDPQRIDWPQRLGDEWFFATDWGPSGLRLDLGAFTAGLSTENMWWGPAFKNPILMSNSGPGFPHLDLGLGRPVGIGIGTLEARLAWGVLTESPYFDTVSTNNHRLFTGLTLGVRPRWIPGLTLGLTRVLYTHWNDSLRAVDFVTVFQPFLKDQIATSTDPEGNDDRDQILSLVAHWILPESRFEAYVEWARNDHSRDLRDLILEPDHSQAYTLGFQQLLGSGRALVRLRGEWTHLGRAPTFQVRATPTFYQHHLVRQGYTERGQLIGAGIGPGSDSQHLAVDRYHARGRWGMFVQRVRYNDDAYYRMYGSPGGRDGHDVELTAGLSALRFVGSFDVGASVALSREINRYYQVGSNVTNLNVQLTVRARRPSR